MSLFDRFRRKRDKPGGPGPSAKSTADIKDFIATREGVEAYLEPPTDVYAMTVCLVALDGEYVRRPVRDERHARQIATEHGVPLYDARKVGYPRRMREFDRGVRHRGVTLDQLPPLEITDRDED